MPRAVHRTKTTNLDSPGQLQRQGPALDTVFQVRIPRALHERCERAAAAEDGDRTLAAWTRWLLRKACEASEAKADKAKAKKARA